MKWLLALAIGAGVAATGKGIFMINDYIASRGIRNNNPGNIRHGDAWQGMADEQTDSAFIQFITPEYGIRAMTKVLLTYSDVYGLDTVAEIISRWAPPKNKKGEFENNTDSYIRAVAASLGVHPQQRIDVRANMPALVEAIIHHENGTQPYDTATLGRGIVAAGVPVPGFA